MFNTLTVKIILMATLTISSLQSFAMVEYTRCVRKTNIQDSTLGASYAIGPQGPMVLLSLPTGETTVETKAAVCFSQSHCFYQSDWALYIVSILPNDTSTTLKIDTYIDNRLFETPGQQKVFTCKIN